MNPSSTRPESGPDEVAAQLRAALAAAPAPPSRITPAGITRGGRRRKLRHQVLPRAVAAAVAVAALTSGLHFIGGSNAVLLPATSTPAYTPSAGTSPEDVVRTYLQALQRHDESTARALETSRFASRSDWAEDPPQIDDITVGTSLRQDPTGTAAEGHAQAVFVPVTFTVHGTGDETMPDGRTSWGYLLMRDGDQDPWLIQDNGDG
jgi:hypothetical protein